MGSTDAIRRARFLVERALEILATLEEADQREADRSLDPDYVPIKSIVTSFSLETVWRDAQACGFGEKRGGRRYVSATKYQIFLRDREKYEGLRLAMTF